MSNVHFSSATDVWATPQDLFDELDSIFGFDLDVCALPSNAKCSRYFTPEQDGLTQQWTGTCWMNPPYGRTIGKWMRKAWESAEQGATVVCLVPARTCTSWWHKYAARGTVTFLRGRLRFGDAKSGAPFPSAVVVFGNGCASKRYIKQCIKCEELFSAERSDRETCSGACRVQRHRDNQKRPRPGRPTGRGLRTPGTDAPRWGGHRIRITNHTKKGIPQYLKDGQSA